MPFTPPVQLPDSERLRIRARERQNIGSRESKLTPRFTVTRVLMPSHSKQPTEHRKAPLVAEEWQLRILRELHNKKPRPTVEQRKLLAAQTGL